jgi:hypothetical protein
VLVYMGILGKIGDVFHKIDYYTSNDPEIIGKRFEDYVENLFPLQYFKLIEKTHSFDTNKERYVESSLNPDFIFEYIPTKEKFAVECKYRSSLNQEGQLEWSYPEELNRYNEFQYRRKIPVFIVIGYVKTTKKWNKSARRYYHEIQKFMFNIPLKEAKYPALYKSVFSKYERDYNKQFSWNNGTLF